MSFTKLFSVGKKQAALWLVSMFLFELAYGQSIEDTTKWIIKQTEVNRAELKHSIADGVLISHVSVGMNVGGLSGGTIEKGIPIGQITGIVYTHTPEYLSYTMSCNKPCAYLLDEPEMLRPKFLFEIYKNLDAPYVERMNKALTHLVKLHGGQATPKKAAATKETF